MSAELLVTIAGGAVASGFGWWMKRQAERLDRALEELAGLKVQVSFLVSQSQRSESAR